MTPVEVAVLLAGAALGAAVARLVRLPMWPLIGAIVGAALAHAAIGGPTTVPAWWSILGQVLVGAVVGSTIARGVFREFGKVLLPGSLAVVTIVGVGVACGFGITATGGVDDVTAVFGMVPGGVGEMVAAATALGADSAVVAGMHVTRLVIVLSALPWLVRWARRMAKDVGEDDQG